MVNEQANGALDERVSEKRRISITRDPELASKFVACFDDTQYSSEQDCIREAMERTIRQCEDQQTLEDLIVQNGGAIPIRIVDDEI